MKKDFIFEVLDIETIHAGGDTMPYALAYSNGTDFKYIRVPNQSKNLAARLLVGLAKDKTIYYVHNLVFDFMVLMRALIKLKVKIKWVYVDHNLYSVNLKHENKDFELRCSYKIIPIKLKRFYPDLSKNPKLFFPYNELLDWRPTKLVQETDNSQMIDKKYQYWTLDDYLEEYAKRDIQILKEGIHIVYNLLLRSDIANIRNHISCGSISMYFFKKKYNTINLNLSKNIETTLRYAYFGGRCEIFGNSDLGDQIVYFDFKGMYQQCMMEPVPCGNFIYCKNTTDFSLPGFYFVKAVVTGCIPVLPFKEGKLLFPEGKIHGWYWFEELQLAVKENQLSDIEISAAYICKEYKPLLSDFIENLSKVRNTSEGFKSMGKLLINAFYGRLGLKESFETINFSEKEKNCSLYAKIDDVFLYKTRKTKKRDSNVGVAAAITSKARVKLFKGFKSVWKNQGRLLYCDTDSIFAAFKQGHSIVKQDLGGGVVFESEINQTTIKDIVFIAPKTYGILFQDGSELIRIKGVDGSHIKFHQLKNSFFSKEESFTTQTPIILKSNFEVRIENTYKKIACNEYDKRIWTGDLKNTTPRKIE